MQRFLCQIYEGSTSINLKLYLTNIAKIFKDVHRESIRSLAST